MKLPNEITGDFNGQFESYDDLVYEAFRYDFVRTSPNFEGTSLKLKRHPLRNSREATYYHLTRKGPDEENRIPCYERMKKIRWARAIIDSCPNDDIKIWTKLTNRKTRILLFHETSRYLVVLDKRKDYILFWTAYPITTNNKVRRLLREYELYCQNNQNS